MPVTAQRQFVSAETTIHDMARHHGITHSRSRLDVLADAITSLAGDAIELDDTECLLVDLDRAQVLTGGERLELHARYLRERAA